MAITLDAITGYDSDVGTDPESFSHTVGSGATLIVVLVATRGGGPVVGVTYGGAALTLARADTPSASAFTEIWYRVSPTAGAATVSVDMTVTPTTTSIRAVSLFGTATSSPIEANNGTTGAGTDLSQTITTVTTGAWILDVYMVRGNPATCAPGTQTGRTNWASAWDYEPGGNEIAAGGTKFENVSVSTYTCDWTQTGGVTASSLSIVAIAQAATGRTTKNTRAWPLGMEIGMNWRGEI